MFERFSPLAAASAVLSLACLGLGPAQAASKVTFVSGKGTDVGDCSSPAAPCRTFQFAAGQTIPFGEVKALDPAGYGRVTITQSISITGVEGVSINAALPGDDITINAGPNDVVNLRHLTLDGIQVAKNGIKFNTGGNLAIENCVIRNFVKAGIDITPLGSSAVTGVLSKVITNNNEFGILVTGSSAGSLKVTIVDSEVSHNHMDGILASGPGLPVVMLRNVVVSHNDRGLEAVAAATIWLAHSVVTGNGLAVAALAPTRIFSYGDNDIDGNTDDNTGSLTPLPMH
jgi:hypothetical protein